MKFKFPIEFQVFCPPEVGHLVSKTALDNAVRCTEKVVAESVLNQWTKAVLGKFPKGSKGPLGL